MTYEEINKGDILKITKDVTAPDFAARGDLVRVTETTKNGVMTENKHGAKCEFVFNCGLEYLEATEWNDDFPSD